MAPTEKQKQSLYFPEDTLREIMKQANRLDRSLSWTVQQAWRLAREEMRKFPGVEPRPERNTAAPTERSVPRPAAVRPAPTPAPARPANEEQQPSAQVLEFLKGKFDREFTT